MSGRRCWVPSCDSASTRPEDRGVTYHRVPREPALSTKWTEAARLDAEGGGGGSRALICSRHFRKADFQRFKAAKFVLKADAIPSIFPWGVVPSQESSMSLNPEKEATEPNTTETPKSNDAASSECVKSEIDKPEGENSITPVNDNHVETPIVESTNETALKSEKSDIICDKDQHAIDRSNLIKVLDGSETITNKSEALESTDRNTESNASTSTGCPIESILEDLFREDPPPNKPVDEVAATKPTVENDEKVEPKVEIAEKTPPKLPAGRPRRHSPTGGKNGLSTKKKEVRKRNVNENSQEKPAANVKIENGALTQGARVEVKDFNDIWYPARIVEVDHNEMEVLIHYDNWSQRFDEWISLQSPRLRPSNGTSSESSISPPTFKVGERCLARWSNNQRFAATVNKILQNGKYEVMFDDGLTRILRWGMMTKITKPSHIKTATSTPNSVLSTNNSATQSHATPTAAASPVQNHLFDPKRDHLGTKEERRHLKRKLDVKELFARKKKRAIGVKNNLSKSLDIGDSRKRKRKSNTPEENTDQKDKGTKMRRKSVPVNSDKVEQDGVVASEPSPQLHVDVPIATNSVKSPPAFNDSVRSPALKAALESPLFPVNETGNEPNKSESLAKNLSSSPTIVCDRNDQVTIGISEEKSADVAPEHDALKSIKVETPIGDRELISSPKPLTSTLTSSSAILPSTADVKPIIEPHLLRAADKDWCCQWVNGQPVGKILDSEQSKDSAGRITVQVEDQRLPPKWTKLLTRRIASGNEGKWDIVLVCPSGRRYRTRGEMQERLKGPDYAELLPYALGLMDFSAHRKQARRRGMDISIPDIKPILNTLPGELNAGQDNLIIPTPGLSEINGENIVYIGSLKVQIIENLLRCPKEGCFKNFRKDNLLQMHIKHYHPELCKFFGDTPNVADLAYARTVVEEPTTPVSRFKDPEKPLSKSKKPADVFVKTEFDTSCVKEEFDTEAPVQCDRLNFTLTRTFDHNIAVTKSEFDSEYDITQWNIKHKNAPKICRPDQPGKFKTVNRGIPLATDEFDNSSPYKFVSDVKKTFKKKISDPAEERFKNKRFADHTNAWNLLTPEHDESRSSFEVSERIGRPSIDRIKDEKEDSNQSTIISETGEKIKIVHMKREEIINCHCRIGEEDGLMIQCELCLCWQHAMCHNITKESEVPEKYVCLICLQPYRGRRSQRYLHDQDWLYEGRLPSTFPSSIDTSRAEFLHKSHELAGNLLQLKDLMHSLRCKMEVAEKKDHPKLYLWSKPWEDNLENGVDIKDLNGENVLQAVTEVLKNVNIPIGESVTDAGCKIEEPTKDVVNGSDPNLFTNLLSSPSGTLELPLTKSDLETLEKTVQLAAPQPEAPIDTSECRLRLLQYIERTQNLLNARLSLIEEQIDQLERQDPYLGEDDETVDNCPRTKQTIQMLLRDLHALEELGALC